MAGSLDGRVRRLEANRRGKPPERSPHTSRTLEEARALDAEIRELEMEMRAHGIDPYECLREVYVDMPLEEHIAKLEEEIAKLGEELRRDE